MFLLGVLYGDSWGPFLYSERTTKPDCATPSDTIYSSPFYTLKESRTDAFVLGQRPENLRGGKAPTSRDLRSLQVFHERKERSPLLIARDLRERFRKSGATSIRQFCRDEGADRSVVSRHLRLLRLPDEIISFLEQNQEPEILRHFSVKRLDALTRLPDAEATSSFTGELGRTAPSYADRHNDVRTETIGSRPCVLRQENTTV